MPENYTPPPTGPSNIKAGTILDDIKSEVLNSDWLKRQVVKYLGVLAAIAGTALTTHLAHIDDDLTRSMVSGIGTTITAGGLLLFEFVVSYFNAHQD